MKVNILFSANEDNWNRYKTPLAEALDATSLNYNLGTGFVPSEVNYIIYAPSSSLQDFSPYTNLKAVLNLWAGVEGVTNNKTLKVPLARMVDVGLTSGMVEWVTGHTLRHHLGIDKHIHGQDGLWRSDVPPLAKDRVVTILGLGTLGTACGINLKKARL
jgi:glyoxylate/hydroxypyruvate reductase A